jgi:undecaprenyl diphosphate synthase
MNTLHHIAIIMDGNGRWATARGRLRTEGHQAGAENAKRLIRTAAEASISVLTLWCFSTENWRRPAAEVLTLMQLFKKFAQKAGKELHEQNIRVSFIGRRVTLDAKLQQITNEVETLTAGNTGLHVRLAINYSGTQEVVDAVNRLWAKNIDVTDQSLLQEITSDLPDYDLVIRTGGEFRVSDFPVRHAELFVTHTLFPDFTAEEFNQIIAAFQSRERRLGGIKTVV